MGWVSMITDGKAVGSDAMEMILNSQESMYHCTDTGERPLSRKIVSSKISFYKRDYIQNMMIQKMIDDHRSGCGYKLSRHHVCLC